LLDELVFGVREAAWPLIRTDLGLSYVQIGLLVSLPNLVGAVVEPGFGLLGDSGHRRPVVVGGGVGFALGLAGFALAGGYGALLIASLILAPASGALVGLSQASLMDLDPLAHDRNMARWVVAGSAGALIGPLALAGSAALGAGWRVPMLVLVLATVPLVIAAGRVQGARHHERLRFAGALRRGFRALARPEVIRWLVLLEVTDLMGDVLFGYLALYFVDVVHVSSVVAGLAVVVWSAAGLAGDALLLPLLRRVDGVRYLRWSAAGVGVAFPMFLLVDGLGLRLILLAVLGVLRAGWYAIPNGRLFSEMSGASGTAFALSSLSGLVGKLLPLAVGALAERMGLGVAMWALLVAPFALLVFLPRPSGPAGDTSVG
jgi:FSR family fosmidomycin resistance protein-like MFS transporter